ncbi:MFS transporter [uncultured Sphingomonas sp.]|uniref:MFS transporter n=1 Tax=uncultured Sphingomonas sp. TaxID=158754 RepID=UPI0035CADECD
MTRFPHRAVPIVLAAVVIDVIGFGVIMPVLPRLITDLGRVDLAEAARIAGWMLAVFAAAQFFAGPILGGLGDRFGRRPVLIASMLAFSADYALMAAAPTLAWLFVGRAVAGAAGAVFGPAGAVLADVSPPDRRAEMFGLMGAAFGAGFIIGPAIGGLVSDPGARAPFIVAAALAGVNALVMFLFLPETLKPGNRRPFRLRDATVVGAFRPLFAAGNAAPLLVAWFLWQLGTQVYPATWSFWASIRFGWDAAAIGWSLAWVGLLNILVQVFLTRRVLDRVGERRAALIGLTASSVTFVTFALAAQGWQVYAFYLFGCIGALAYPALNGLMSRSVDATRQGALQGGIGSMNSVAQIVGPLLASQSLAAGAARGLPGSAFVVAAALTAAALLVIAIRLPHLRPTQAPAGEAP